MDLSKIDSLQMDALREISNIGAGHAATALSELTGQKVIINIPVINVYPLNDIITKAAAPEELVVGIQIGLSGPITGRTLLLFTEDEARSFAACLMGQSNGASQNLDAAAESALREANNILTCAYMNALGDMMGFVVIPTTPQLVAGKPGEVLDGLLAQGQSASDLAVSINNEFRFLDRNAVFRGFYLLLSDAQSLTNIFKALHLI
jgi:chemotaxis protein CheC